jgi:serine/threonine-protein kinase HipA
MVNVSRDNNIELLLLNGWAEPGATGFAKTVKEPTRLVLPMDMAMTDQAITASETFEKDAGMIDLPDFFISGGSSAGGARPKVLARSGEDLYLVKFPSINDPAPEVMAHLEFFGMSCAKQAGIPVPDFFLIKTSSPRTALAVKRFDTVNAGGRLHFLSFQSLVGVEEQLGLPYSRMADIIKKISADPESDLGNLYKQMIVNVLICNGDDHLKNFSMIYNPAAGGFRLTPAYDVVPNLWQREHILSIAGKTSDITHNDLLQEGKFFTLSNQRTRQLIKEASQGVANALQENTKRLQQLSATYPLCSRLLDDIQHNLDSIMNRKNTGRT